MLDAINVTTGIALDPAPATPASLIRVVPNPLMRSGSIAVTVPGDARAHVRLRLYDVAGRFKRLVHDAPMVPGSHTIAFDAVAGGTGTLGPGVYFLRAEIDGKQVGVVRAVVSR